MFGVMRLALPSFKPGSLFVARLVALKAVLHLGEGNASMAVRNKLEISANDAVHVLTGHLTKSGGLLARSERCLENF